MARARLKRFIRSRLGCSVTNPKIKRVPKKWEYTDLALSPVTDEEVETLEIFHTHSAGVCRAGAAAAAGERRSARARGGIGRDIVPPCGIRRSDAL